MKKHMKKALTLLFLALLLAFPGAVALNARAEPASPDAARAESLAQVDQMVLDKNYARALEALEAILSEDPAADEAYQMKLRLRILALKASNDALNGMIARDLDRVGDRSAYVSLAKELYEAAGLRLVIPFKSDYASAGEVNSQGTTSGNLSSTLWLGDKRGEGDYITGIFAAQGDWVYFANPQDGYSLWKMRAGGEEARRILQDGAASLNVNGDWIYYRAIREGNALYKVRTDGSEKTLLTGNNCANLFVKDEWIYYTNAGEGNALYKIRIEGDDNQALGEKGTLLFIEADYLYYASEDGKNLFRLNIWDGGKEALLKKQWFGAIRMIDGQLYYVADQKGMVLMRMRSDGGGKEEILRIDGKLYCYAISGDRLVLSLRAGAEKAEVIVSYDLNAPKNPRQAADISTEALCMDARGGLYFLNNDGVYRLDPAGDTARKIL
jgi:outer membrane protein assembly factor BamB